MFTTHNHFTRSSKKMSVEEALGKLQNELSSQISNLTNEVRSTLDEVINLKDVIIKRLQEENDLLWARCSKLENKVIDLELSINHIEQYGRRNNIVISGIPDDINDNDLESTVIKLMKDVDVYIDSGDIEACHKLASRIVKHQARKQLFAS